MKEKIYSQKDLFLTTSISDQLAGGDLAILESDFDHGTEVVSQGVGPFVDVTVDPELNEDTIELHAMGYTLRNL